MTSLLSAFVMAWTVTASPAPEPVPAQPQTAAPDPVHRVYLGVDCSKPFMVSLPDDVLTECEGERGAPKLD